MPFTQDNRRLQIFTPLGDDVLLLEGFSGQEAISLPFQFELSLLSENRSVTFESVVGKSMTVALHLMSGKTRYFNGIVSSFSQGGSSQYFSSYTATLVPWLWLLKQTANCRIFQHKSVPDIIESIFNEHGFKDFSNKLHGSFPERDYCVQYRETDFNFVTRLMEEEGIFYFFKHEDKKHTLVFANNPSEFNPSPLTPEASYSTIVGASGDEEDVVTNWVASQEVVPGKFTVTDFDFEKPNTDLTATVDGKDPRKFEVYDFPGEYTTKDEGDRLVGIRMEEHDGTRTEVRGASNSMGFMPGYRFDLVGHFRRDANKAYTLLSVRHSSSQRSFSSEEEGGGFHYANSFQCITHPTPFRPPRTAVVPVINGTQTAIVVGPAGEEIYVDKYGRVKVQFHWDRDGKYDEKSSCWVRVSQNWAGKRWGAMFIPRIGQEVIVDFIEGDPDRPIITGRVYNGASMPPYALPDEKTKSTVKTYSSKGGGGFNELRFEDKKGSEQIFIHAEKDKHVRVKNDRKEWIGHDSDLIVKHDQKEEVDGNKHLTVKGDQNEEVKGTVSLKVGQDLQQKVGMKHGLQAGMEVHIKAGMNVVIEAGMSITLKAGGGFVVVGPAGVTISGTPVLINSGGAAGSGSGCSPHPPEAPKEADKAEPGAAVEMPPKKHHAPPATYSPAAIIMKQAAQSGTPFCDI